MQGATTQLREALKVVRTEYGIPFDLEQVPAVTLAGSLDDIVQLFRSVCHWLTHNNLERDITLSWSDMLGKMAFICFEANTRRPIDDLAAGMWQRYTEALRGIISVNNVDNPAQVNISLPIAL